MAYGIGHILHYGEKLALMGAIGDFRWYEIGGMDWYEQISNLPQDIPNYDEPLSQEEMNDITIKMIHMECN